MIKKVPFQSADETQLWNIHTRINLCSFKPAISVSAMIIPASNHNKIGRCYLCVISANCRATQRERARGGGLRERERLKGGKVE